MGTYLQPNIPLLKEQRILEWKFIKQYQKQD